MQANPRSPFTRFARIARVRRLVAVMLFGIGCATAAAQPPSPILAPSPAMAGPTHTDYIIVEGHSVQIPSVTTASGAGGVYWLRTTGGGATLGMGVDSYSIAGSRWAVGKAGGSFRPFDRLVLHSQAQLGGGRLGGDRFDHRMYEAGLAYRAAGRLHLTVAEQYWHVADTRGHVIKPGVSWYPHRRVSTELTYARSVSGNLNANLAAARFGVSIWALTFIGGAANGGGVAELFDVTFRGTAASSLTETFAGVQIQLPRAQVTLFGTDLDIASAHKRTVTASIKYRLGGR